MILKSYAVLLRGINVGGKNKISMAALRDCLEQLGYRQVATYIASGNVLLQSDKSAGAVQKQIEAALPKQFALDTSLVRILVLSPTQLQSVVGSKPAGFGEQPETYHSDVIFLMGISAAEAMKVFRPRDGVDRVWPGEGVVYSQRLSAERTRSRLSSIVGTPAYQSMTIRTWNTTTKLLERLKTLDAAA